MRPNKYVIGLTGGVGAGKSTVLDYLKESYHVSVLKADEIGAELMRPGKSLFFALVESYGETILSEDGTIDKKKLADIAFRDEASQKRINAIEHPVIREEIIRRIESCVNDVIFLEAALLKEGDLLPVCKEVWLVTCDPEVRIGRLMSSRKYSREKCEQIIERQMSEKEFKSFSNLVITNNNNFEDTADLLDYHMSCLSQDLRKNLKRN